MMEWDMPLKEGGKPVRFMLCNKGPDEYAAFKRGLEVAGYEVSASISLKSLGKEKALEVLDAATK